MKICEKKLDKNFPSGGGILDEDYEEKWQEKLSTLRKKRHCKLMWYLTYMHHPNTQYSYLKPGIRTSEIRVVHTEAGFCI